MKKPNYIKLINWFWDEVPFMEGYKAFHAALFFAIVDGINKNNWADNTPIAYDRLINKIKVSKKVYLESRNWLMEKGIIETIPGKNTYQMAVFNLSVEVRNLTATDTATDAAILTATDTALDTSTLPQSLPIIKHIKSKPLNHKQKTFKNFSEEEFENEISFFKDHYDESLLKEFFDYWKEKSSTGKMKFQLQPTWETKLRLNKWKSNKDRYEKSTNPSDKKTAGASSYFSQLGQYGPNGKNSLLVNE